MFPGQSSAASEPRVARVGPKTLSLSVDHAPNLTKRDRARAVAVRFLHPCDVANEKFPIRQSTRSSTRFRPRHARRRRRSRLREGTGIPSRRASSRRRAPPVVGADLRAALVASCLRGALPPVDFLAVCFVRAIAVDRSAFESVDAVAARGLDTDRLGELQDSATRAVATDGARALEGETAP